jgi:hypothetical protein
MQGVPKRESAADFSTGNRTEKTGSTGRYLSTASSGHRLDVMPLELGQAFKAEVIPDVTEEVAAVKLSGEEQLVLSVGKVEVPVDVTASHFGKI